MLSKGLLNYSFYKLFKNLYNNYKEQKTLKNKFPLIYNVPKNKYDYKYRK